MKGRSAGSVGVAPGGGGGNGDDEVDALSDDDELAPHVLVSRKPLRLAVGVLARTEAEGLFDRPSAAAAGAEAEAPIEAAKKEKKRASFFFAPSINRSKGIFSDDERRVSATDIFFYSFLDDKLSREHRRRLGKRHFLRDLPFAR